MPKGVSGNPKGRPPKNRALTEILERAGAASLDINGERVSGKRMLARLAWEAATTGKLTMPDGSVLTLDFDQWLGIAKFIYSQIDGPPKQSVELSGHVDLSKLSDDELRSIAETGGTGRA